MLARTAVVNQLNDVTKEVDMRHMITCSWCHERNDCTERPTLCCKCGHRADLPRLECDCRRCLDPKVAPSPGGVESDAKACRRGIV